MSASFPDTSQSRNAALQHFPSSAVNKTASSLPWAKGSGTSLPSSTPSASIFYPPVDIKADHWNGLYPYRLLVIDTTKNNMPVNSSTNASVSVTGNASSAIVNFTTIGQQWEFTLPITPEQLSITDQYAINTTPTLRGIVEEHSGLKFKLINAAGSFGVWPYRPSVAAPPSQPSALESIFGGTLSAVNNLVTQVQGTINTFTTGHPANAPITNGPTGSLSTSTGYYIAMALQQFLEQYVEAKKDPKNVGWRLVFDIPKQNQSLIVQPISYQFSQNAQKPLEYKYALALKAWRRINLKQTIFPVSATSNGITPDLLQRVLNTVTAAQSAAASAVNLIGAVQSDLEKPLDIMRQTAVFVKDLVGAVITAADLPFQLQKDYASGIDVAFTTIGGAINIGNTNAGVQGALQTISQSHALSEGLGHGAVAGGQLGSAAANLQKISGASSVYNNPIANFDLMSQVPITAMKLNNRQKNAVDQVIQKSRNLTVDDLRSFRTNITGLALNLSNSFGSGTAFYNSVYGRPAPTTRIQPLTVDEFTLLNKLYDLMQAYDLLTATTQIDDNNRQTSMDFVAGLAAHSKIEFQSSSSKVLAPVPFKLSIEGIAQRYLGNPQRWLEIVTLNNLQAPYIDEDGFTLPLLSNATGRQITVSSIDNLYVGQRTIMMSGTQPSSVRTILGLDRLTNASYLITLDGDANLDSFLFSDGAYLQAYLPGTVNSQQKIYIPSDLPVPNDPNILIPNSATGDPLSGLSKVDLLLTDSGDLAINSYGDFRFSYGMTNIIQALKVKFGSKLGSWILHPEFGIGTSPGQPVSEVTVSNIYSEISRLIQADPRFSGLARLQIVVNGPTLTINAGVFMAGLQGVFPLTFNL